MEKHITNHNHYMFYVITFFSLIIAFVFLTPFLSLIILSILTVSLFNPFYFLLSKKLPNRKNLVLAITIVFITLVLIIPATTIILLTINQLQILSADVSEILSARQERNLDEYVTSITVWVNGQISKLPFIQHEITENELRGNIDSFVAQVVAFFLGVLKSLGSNLGNYLTFSVIYLMLLAYLFPNQKVLTDRMISLIPLDDDTTKFYLDKIMSMAKSMVMGTFVIALIQGVVAAISLSIAGVPYVFFFAILFVFLSIIPLGSGVIALPIGVALLLFNNILGGLIVLFVNGVIVTNIDNLLRPKLVSKDVRLPEVYILIAIFSGIELFGFIGFVYGPVIMIFIYTTLSLYIRKYNFKTHHRIN